MALLDAYASHVLRSEGIGDAVADAIVACGRTARRESFASLAASFGFDGFSYILLGGPVTQPRLLEHWTSSGPAWTARYLARVSNAEEPRETPKEVWRYLGKSLLESGKPEEALTLMEAALRLNPLPPTFSNRDRQGASL